MRELVIDPDDVGALHLALTDVVNREEHAPECAFRCVPPEDLNCGLDHACPVCEQNEPADSEAVPVRLDSGV